MRPSTPAGLEPAVAPWPRKPAAGACSAREEAQSEEARPYRCHRRRPGARPIPAGFARSNRPRPISKGVPVVDLLAPAPATRITDGPRAVAHRVPVKRGVSRRNNHKVLGFDHLL